MVKLQSYLTFTIFSNSSNKFINFVFKIDGIFLQPKTMCVMASHWLVTTTGFVQMHGCRVYGRLVSKKPPTFLFVSFHQRFINTVSKSWCPVQSRSQRSPKNAHVYRTVSAVCRSCCVVQVLRHWNFCPAPLQAWPVEINKFDLASLFVVVDIGCVTIPVGEA